MNESIDSDSALAAAKSRTSVKQGQAGNAKNWTSSITEAAVTEINIKDKKEGWLSGRAEVSFAGVKFGAPNNVETYCTIGRTVAALPLTKVRATMNSENG
ncbi:MAG: hypothetical protein R3B47_00860 [Bacteroidia bacterium]